MKQEQQINIAALLKDCQKGTRLYSTICGECVLVKEDTDHPVAVESEMFANRFAFNEYGQWSPNGECLLFPSKDVRDWSVFNVKYVKGSKDKGNQLKELLEENGGWCDPTCFCEEDAIYYIDRLTKDVRISSKLGRGKEYYDYILSTGTELKLEKEPPKFFGNIGDVVKYENDFAIIVNVEGKIEIAFPTEGKGLYIHEPLPFATPEEIAKWNKEVLEPNHLHYSKGKRKIIHWFLPFDEVIVQEFHSDDEGFGCSPYAWRPDFFGYKDKETGAFVCVGGAVAECLPYNSETARLVGTADEWGEEA